MVLGVRRTTASSAVRGELGLWRISSRMQLAVLRWWGKIVLMARDRLVHQIYRYRKAQTKESKSSWCRYVRDLLNSLNLGHVWLSEDIGTLGEWSALTREKILVLPRTYSASEDATVSADQEKFAEGGLLLDDSRVWAAQGASSYSHRFL